MRVAIVSGTPLFPTTAGNRARILNIARAVRRLGHDLHFLFLLGQADHDPLAHRAELGELGYLEVDRSTPYRVLDLLRRKRSAVLKRLRRPFGWGSPQHSGIDERYPLAFTSDLRRLHRSFRFDAVIVEYVFHSAALNAFPGDVLKILDAHDSFADRHLAVTGGDYWFSTSVEGQRRGFARADVVIAIQEEEARLFERQIATGRPQVRVVSHILESSARISSYASPNALFLGSANHANVSGIRWFIEQVLPEVSASLPHFRLLLAGTVSAAVDSHPAVVKLGKVDHVAGAFEQAPFSINPVRAGTGINIKLLDAMACGAATVSSATGARGLPERFRSGVKVVPDDDAEAFARAVVEFASSESLRRELGEKAYAAAHAWNEEQLSALAELLTPGNGTSKALSGLDGPTAFAPG